MKTFLLFKNEWLPWSNANGTKAQAIAAKRFKSATWEPAFGPASRTECEKHAEANNYEQAVWRIQEAA